MKLLIVIPSTSRGGAEEYSLTIASAAVNNGWQTHAAFPDTSGTASLIQDLQANGVNYHPLDITDTRTHNLKHVSNYVPQMVRTIALLLKIKPDIVTIVLPCPDQCLGSILACGLLKTPTIVRFALIPYQFSFSTKILQVYAWARARNQQWLTISQNNRQLVSKMFAVPSDEIACIYNGTTVKSEFLNITPQESARNRREVRQELGLAENSQILLTVGRLDEQKGYFYLIPTIASVVAEFPDAKFVWVGDGEQREILFKQAQECGVSDRILWLGYRSDVPRLLKAADLFVFPTLYEGGQSFALAEAMAYGLPIVSSDASGIPEILEHKVHALLFPVKDCDRLRESLLWALRHPDAMQAMADKAKIRAKDFSHEKMVANYIELWKNAIANQK